MKKSILLTSLSTIAACVAVVSGATYALFTSESKVNVAVTSGTVDVVATAENFKVYSGQWNASANKYDIIETGSNYFTNGGYVDFTDGHSIKISGMSALDYVSFDLKVKNNSDIEIKYQTVLSTIEDTGLFDALDITLAIDGGTPFDYDGTTDMSAWTNLAPGNDLSTISVKLGLPEDSNAQGLASSIEYAVYAVQANGHTEDPQADVRYIYTVRDLKAFRDEVNAGNTFKGKTVQLMNDMDLNNQNWEPIGNAKEVYFAGTFEGNGHTISNMYVESNSYTGFFGSARGNAVIQNVKFDGAEVVSKHYGAVVAGYLYGNVYNCEINDASVTLSTEWIESKSAYDNGDKAGIIAGFMSSGGNITNEVVGNIVKNVSVTGYRDIGGLVGYIANDGGVNFPSTVTDNQLSNATITLDANNPYSNASTNAGEIYGRILNKDYHTIDNNTVTGVTFNTAVRSASELTTALTSGNDVVLSGDVETTDTLITVPADKDVEIDLNGHKISGISTVASTSALMKVAKGGKLSLVGEGTVEFGTNVADTDWGTEGFPTYATNTIRNEGTLIVDGPTLINRTLKGGASYVIDNYVGSNLIVNSGEIIQSGNDVAIRMFNASANGEINVTINGGYIKGYRAVWIQVAGSNASIAPNMNLNINGGTLESSDIVNYHQAIYSYSFGNSFANVKVNITGGLFKGDVAFGGGYKGDQETVVVTGGTLDTGCSAYRYTTGGSEDIAWPNA